MVYKLPDRIAFIVFLEATEAQIGRAQVSRRQTPASGKVRVSCVLDARALAYLKARAGGRGFQTLMNEALKEKIRIRELETLLRRVIREEFHAGK